VSVRKHVPRNGPARALWEADEDTPVQQIPELLDDVERWECVECGTQKFTRPERCQQCCSTEFVRVVPADTEGSA